MFRSTLSSWREYLTPVSHKSTFKKTGEITPEEFVEAGDYLVFKFPTWQWSPASANKRKDFLPKDKQFLVTRHVPSYQRASTYLGMDNNEEDEEEIIGEDGWTATHISKLQKNKNDNNNSHDNQSKTTNKTTDNENSIDEIEDIEDIEDFDEEIDLNDDNNDNNFNNSNYSNKDRRNYDLYIGYSTSYKVPKMYLVGFDSNGIPLNPDQMFEDISGDYRDKTATIEKAPFLNDTTSVSIHPCRHATVMKVLMARAEIAAKNKQLREKQKLEKEKEKEEKEKESDKNIIKRVAKLGLMDSDDTGADIDDDEEWESIGKDIYDNQSEIIRVDQYLIIFLKFIASVTPGINHDYTMDAF
ncbi:Atg3p ASCRUDRAFT_77657 [Ascoidea rubescens DSM 1968]|uniref:Autophagy-related protein 3 n=1 Tax=Ascoidea rubescens DSM 1968 TaxID=1344418 RepID=A0A1D2VB08_9ASCO|nr:hypothetical protein ASCRUDRAFT_77657 [Ascoidea rubescens DSM 1968]ODV58643.1 hypothetical protein ASCRUDRAFT_77657 [Ascoidea rubescens DSM 1968]